MKLIFDKAYQFLNVIITNYVMITNRKKKKKTTDGWTIYTRIQYVYRKKNIVLAIIIGIGSCAYRKRVFVCFSKYCDIADNQNNAAFKSIGLI